MKAVEVVRRLSGMGRDWKQWGKLAAFCGVAFAAVLVFHALEYPQWNVDALKVNGEFIMGTHDAYHWLAGAQGIGHATDLPLSQLLKKTSEWTGIRVGLIGFWLPAIFAGFVSVVMVLWAWTLGRMEIGLAAGVLTALAPGFYFRTRLGYCDTDIVTLLFPIMQGWMLAHWIAPHLRGGFLPAAMERRLGVFLGEEAQEIRASAPEGTAFPGFLWVVVAGIFTRLSNGWHGDITPFSQLLFLLALGLVLLRGKPRVRTHLLWGLAVYALCGYEGTIGLAGAAIILGVARFRRHWFEPCRRSLWPPLTILLFLLASMGAVQGIWGATEQFAAVYLKPVAQVEQNRSTGEESSPRSSAQTAPPVVYPSVTQSVIEAQNETISQTLFRIHPWAELTVLGLLGYGLALAWKPLTVFLLPLLVLALGAFKLGARMTMFGGPAFALGASFVLFFIAKAVTYPRCIRRVPIFLLEGIFLLVTLIPYWSIYPILPPTPILNKEHCLALLSMRDISPKDSIVWTWWDWGYATHYYAQRQSFADGARHGGEYVFPLGVAFMTHNPLQSNQIMKFSSATGDQPWTAWNKESAENVKNFLYSVGVQKYDIQTKSRQYIVVSSENFKLLPWISFFGTWDVLTHDGVHARAVQLQEQFSFNKGAGTLTLQDGQVAELASYDILSQQGREYHAYERELGWHLVVNQAVNEAFLLDDLAYGSMAVQLLMVSPDNPTVKEFFSLVYDRFPWVRIYEVR